ncbi:MAG: phosphate ABC transporter permease PstA [Anaerolineales bacterium]|nr:phosphate ABC transporter permease PstA [Anaerolineales bacterium]
MTNTASSTHFIRARRGYTRRRTANAVMLVLTGLTTALALIPLFWIIGYVVYQGGQYLTPAFFTELPTPPGTEGGGVWNAIQGTILLVILAGLFALPPGLLAAFYAAYYPNTPLGIAVRFSTDVLAGVPSIVIGLFLYALVVVVQGHFSGLAGGIALAILMLPTIIRTTEEMLKLVPPSLREASLALGAPEWKTSLQVVLPAAGNGLITGFLLGLARASGETAPLLFTALGNEWFDFRSLIRSGLESGMNPLEILVRIIEQPVDSLPLTLWKYAQQPYPERIHQAWAAALVLMAFVLAVNIFARLWILFRARRMKG